MPTSPESSASSAPVEGTPDARKGRRADSIRGKVLVLGRDNQALLAIVRSLGRAGLEVHVAWCAEGSMTLRSRYVSRAHHLRAYSPGGRWLDELIALLDREKFELVIPAGEQALHPLQAHRRALEPHARIYLLDDDVAAIAFDKEKMHALAASAGVRVPRQIAVRDRAVEMLIRELGFPVVLKPRSSYRADVLSRRRDVAKAYDRAELEARLEKMLEDGGEVLAQENVLGIGAGVEVLCDAGEVLFAFQHERVHEPLRGGGSSYRKSTALDPELLDASKKLIRALEYTGVAMIEFKVDRAANTWAFLEINARFWGSLPLAVAAGADFPYWLHQLLIEGRREFPAKYREGLYARNLIGDLKWMGQNLTADRSDPTLATRPLPALAGELANIALARETSDTFVLDDPRPAAVEVAYYVQTYASLAVDRLRARAQALSVFRDPQSRRASRALARAKSVMFVCKGNICRSPFAHYLAAKLRPEWIVTSSGFYPEEKRTSPAEAVRAAAERGIELDTHRSRRIDAAMVRDADVIFAFDEETMRQLAREYPWAMWKVHRFGVLSRDGGVEVTDPYGGDVDGFRRCYARIEDTLRAFVENRA